MATALATGRSFVPVTVSCSVALLVAPCSSVAVYGTSICKIQPDTRHRFVIDRAPGVERVRLDVHPDGGMGRLRLWGRPTARGRSELGHRWFSALPDVQALEVLGSLVVPPQVAGRLVGARQLAGDLPPDVARLLDGPAV